MEKLIYTLVVLLGLGFLFLANSNNKGDSSLMNQIELSGHFYKFIPYHLKLPKEMKEHELSIDAQYVEFESLDYDSTQKVLRFNVKENNHAHFTIGDSISNEFLKINIKAKSPPMSLFFVSKNKQYKSGSSITKNELKLGGGFIAPLLNFDIDFRAPVVEFNLVVADEKGLHSYPSKGALLNEKQKEVLAAINKDAVLVFNNIKIIGFDEREENKEPFVLFLKTSGK